VGNDFFWMGDGGGPVQARRSIARKPTTATQVTFAAAGVGVVKLSPRVRIGVEIGPWDRGKKVGKVHCSGTGWYKE